MFQNGEFRGSGLIFRGDFWGRLRGRLPKMNMGVHDNQGQILQRNGTNFVDSSTQCLAEKTGLYNMTISETLQQDHERSGLDIAVGKPGRGRKRSWFGGEFAGYDDAAFLGTNGQVEKLFLAQAPGPGVASSNIKPIGPNGTWISADLIQNFAETWERDWTVFSDTDIKNTTAVLTVATKRPEGTSNTGNSKTLTATPTGATDGQNRTSDS